MYFLKKFSSINLNSINPKWKLFIQAKENGVRNFKKLVFKK